MTLSRTALFLLTPLFALLASCGTTSDLKSETGESLAPGKKFSRVIVKDFADKTGHEESYTAAKNAGRLFASKIRSQVLGTNKFASVKSSGRADSNTLVIDGNVTKFTEGNAALRLFVGMGAGSSYFNADVNFRDGATMKPLGEVKVDKNSWGLGGSIAAGQTVEKHMDGAAKKIATQAAKLAR